MNLTCKVKAVTTKSSKFKNEKLIFKLRLKILLQTISKIKICICIAHIHMILKSEVGSILQVYNINSEVNPLPVER
jgi:hypothetical protein